MRARHEAICYEKKLIIECLAVNDAGILVSLYIYPKQSLTACGLDFITRNSLLGEARNSQARSRKHPASRGSPIIRKGKFSKTNSLYINLLATFPLRKLSLELVRSLTARIMSAEVGFRKPSSSPLETRRVSPKPPKPPSLGGHHSENAAPTSVRHMLQEKGTVVPDFPYFNV